MKKSESLAWKYAVRLSRRKHTLWFPVTLSPNGDYVTVEGLIRGNQWNITLNDLEAVVNKRRLFQC